MGRNFCDNDGWGWHRRYGPTLCVTETLSISLSIALLVAVVPYLVRGHSRHSTSSRRGLEELSADTGGAATRVQYFTVILQATLAPAFALALTWGKEGDIVSGALLLHCLGQVIAWGVNAELLRRDQKFSEILLWWWLAEMVFQSIVLSALYGASLGHHGHAELRWEVASLCWLLFSANVLLVGIQLAKDETYTTLRDRPSRDGGGWQALGFERAWGSSTFPHALGTVEAVRASGSEGGLCSWFCGHLRWPWRHRHRQRNDADGSFEVLGERLLGETRGQERWGTSLGWGQASEGSTEAYRLQEGSVVGGSKLKHSVDDDDGGVCTSRGPRACGEWGQRSWRLSRRLLGWVPCWPEGGRDSAMACAPEGGDDDHLSWRVESSAVAGGAPTGLGRGHGDDRSVGGACYTPLARPPPQASAPVYSVSVTRWRVVNTDGLPVARGPTSDDWTEVSLSSAGGSSRSSALTAAASSLSEICSQRPPPLRTSTIRPSVQAGTAAAAMGSSCPGAVDSPVAAVAAQGGLCVQFELLVRASGQGEIDWWGHGTAGMGAPSGDTSAAGVPDCGYHHDPAPPTGEGGHQGLGLGSSPGEHGEWRVWRSAADALALHDIVSLRFGHTFSERIKRPPLRTGGAFSGAGEGNAGGSGDAGGTGGADGAGGKASLGSSDRVTTGMPHRVDMARDARTLGGYLRQLLGLRQFLSIEVRDFLRQPTTTSLPSHRGPSGAGGHQGGEHVQNNAGAEAGGKGMSDSGSRGEVEWGIAPGEQGSFIGEHTCHLWGHAGLAGAGTGARVGVAAGADHDAWLARMAVRLRRAVPEGERFVRLHHVDRAVTGEQVVWWLVTSSGECRGDRAAAVRMGQDMVSRGLLRPICMGYSREDSEGKGAGSTGWQTSNEEGVVSKDRNLAAEEAPARSFDDAVGWLFTYAGAALRDPYTTVPEPVVSAMTGSPVEVQVDEWIEVMGERPYAEFLVRTRLVVTHEAWEVRRRYRDFVQLRKRLVRLGVAPAGPSSEGGGGGMAPAVDRAGGSEEGKGDGGVQHMGLGPALPRRTWRLNKLDRAHLEARRTALESYLKGVVKAALGVPNLAGPMVMHFLDPDATKLRLLISSKTFRSAGWGLGEAREGTGETSERGYVGGEEAEEFERITASLGGLS